MTSVLLLGLLVLRFTHGAVWEGSISTSANFVFLERFAFAETSATNASDGLWSYTVNASALSDEAVPESDVQMDLYFDSDAAVGGWFGVWGNDSLSCVEKRAAAAKNTQNRSLDANVTYGATRTVGLDDQHAAHFWYFALSNCNFNATRNASQPRWGVQYRMVALNPGDDQFSADEDGLLGLNAAFVVFYAGSLLLVAHAVFALRQLNMLSLAVKLVAGIVLLHTLATLSAVIHYGDYASNGVGLKGFLVLDELLDTVAQSTMLILLLLLAQGWCVTSATVRDPTASRCAAVLVVLVYVVLFFWRVLGESRESTLCYYESVPGAFALVLRMLFCGYFLLSLRLTWREETNPKTRNFYLTFGGLFFLWFVVLVFIVLIAAATPPVYRARTVETMYTLQNWVATTVLVLLFHPLVANRFFEIGGDKASLMAKSLTNTNYQAL